MEGADPIMTMSESPPRMSRHPIATLREARGLTQAQLATRAHVSASLLSKVEVFDRPATYALITAVARALQVPVERLSGQPYTDNRRDELVHRDIDLLRTVLRCYDLPDEVPPRSPRELAADVGALARLRAAANYRALAARLPALLTELGAAAHTADTAHQAQLNALLVSAYHAAHTLTYRLGYPNLTEGVEHKLAYAANRTADPLAGALAQWARAQWARAQSFQAAGDYTHGLQLMDTARHELGNELSKPTGAALTVYGSLHLRSATLASRAGDADTARDHLRAARDLATQLKTGDQVHYGLTFGPANTTTHEVAAYVELGDGAAAITAAQSWQPSRTMPRTRRGHHHIDLARAYLIHGDRAGALRELQQARQIAPQQTRLHPMVRETTAVLLSLHRRSNPELSKYAGWLGLTS
jgi:transcriptional regulator with XRE-family HTH domain